MLAVQESALSAQELGMHIHHDSHGNVEVCDVAGYDIGATSGALVSLKSAVTSGTSW